jgi:transposase
MEGTTTNNITTENTRSPQVQLVEMSIHEAVEWQARKTRELEEQVKDFRERFIALELQLERERRKSEALERLASRSRNTGSSPTQRGKTTPIEPSIRALIVEKVSSGEMTWAEAARNYNVSRSTVARIVAEAKRKREDQSEEQQPPPKKQRGRRPKLSGDDILEILEWIEDDNGLRLKDIRVRLAERSITVSKPTLCKYLAKMDITYKSVLSIPERWNTDTVIRQRQEFVLKLLTLSFHTKVYIDESSLNLHVRRRKGWARQGAPARLTLLPKGCSTSLIASLFPSSPGLHKFIDSTSKKPGVTGEDFIIFLNAVVNQLPSNSVLIFDNAKIHHSEAVRQFLDTLRKGRGVEVLYLPPYSPFLNPIEYAFSKIKQIVGRAEFRNKDELKAAIDKALNEITEEDIQGWTKHTQKYYGQCLLGLPFRGSPLYPEFENVTSHCVRQQVPILELSSPAPLPQLPSPASPHSLSNSSTSL